MYICSSLTTWDWTINIGSCLWTLTVALHLVVGPCWICPIHICMSIDVTVQTLRTFRRKHSSYPSLKNLICALYGDCYRDPLTVWSLPPTDIHPMQSLHPRLGKNHQREGEKTVRPRRSGHLLWNHVCYICYGSCTHELSTIRIKKIYMHMLALLLVPTSDAILSSLHPQRETAALFLRFICANLKNTTQF